MTFEEFLVYIREHIGNYCTDSYWHVKYDNLEKRTKEYIDKELPYLAVNAVGTDYASKNI